MLKQAVGAVLVMFSTVAMANGTPGTKPKGPIKRTVGKGGKGRK
jgi:hypothetical protein